MLVWGWMVFPLLIYGIWSLLFFTEIRIRVIKYMETCLHLLREKKNPGKIDDLNNVYFVSSNANSSREEVLLHVFEDNEAVIKMVNFYVHLEGVDFVLLLDVQESYISISHFHRFGNHFIGCWTANGCVTCSQFMGCAYRSGTFIEQHKGTHWTCIWNQIWDVRLLTHPIQDQTEGRHRYWTIVTLEYVPSNAHSCQGESQLYIFEHSEAVIRKDNQGKNTAVRHVSRTHRVAFDWLFDRINFDSKIQIRYASHFSQCCTTDYTPHMRGSSRKFGVRTSHLMSHLHALMLCVWFSSTTQFSSPCCPSSLLSSCLSSWPSTSSSTM